MLVPKCFHVVEKALLVLLVSSGSLVYTVNNLFLLKQWASCAKALHRLLIVHLLIDGAVLVHLRRVIEHALHFFDALLLASERHRLGNCCAQASHVMLQKLGRCIDSTHIAFVGPSI